MNTKKCCMVGCSNVESENDGNDSRKLYVFPKDFNLCMLWVQNSGQPEYFEDFAFAGAQPFLNRHICSDHFNDTDFVKPKDKTSGLLLGAVPNLNFTFPKVEVKEEQIDPEFAEALAGTLVSETELINDVKLEKFENDNCDEVSANFSFSSSDDSCNDLLGVNLSTNTTEIYKETEEDKELSNQFFRKYRSAVRGNRSSRRPNETEEERMVRLKREALRAKIRRSQETEEQKRIRRMKNALRAAFRRKNETPEQRALRKKKDMLRAQRRRKAETETEARIRRYNDAVRAAFRRNNETEEQRMERKMKDIMRAAKRRSMETLEQREMRLRKDRERASRRRMLKKIAEQMSHLNSSPEFAQKEVPIKIEPANASVRSLMMPTLNSIATQCNESSSLERLQQVLDFIECKTNKTSRRRTRAEKTAESNERPVHYIDLLVNPNIIPCAANSVYDKSESLEDDIFHENYEDPVNCDLMVNSSLSTSSKGNITEKSEFIGTGKCAEETRCNENATSFLKLVKHPNSVAGTVENTNDRSDFLNDVCYIENKTVEKENGLVQGNQLCEVSISHESNTPQNFIAYDSTSSKGNSEEIVHVLEPEVIWG